VTAPRPSGAPREDDSPMTTPQAGPTPPEPPQGHTAPRPVQWNVCPDCLDRHPDGASCPDERTTGLRDQIEAAMRRDDFSIATMVDAVLPIVADLQQRAEQTEAAVRALAERWLGPDFQPAYAHSLIAVLENLEGYLRLISTPNDPKDTP
jgi:hypothetical protein